MGRGVIATMEGEADPLLRLRAFVTAQLEAAAASKHQAALREAVEQIGLEAAAAVAPMVQAVVSSAYGQIRAGADADRVMQRARRFVEGGLGALTDPG